MVKFAFLDYFWLVLYLILMTGAGVLFYNLGKRSEADFFSCWEILTLVASCNECLCHAYGN
ncbi:hypothetical protein JGI6_01492 [Candidatus Kryptonium thompsonii]|nr:hypothetical protein JGI6_01492 [Candidatus Kryptonium thompsoni]